MQGQVNSTAEFSDCRSPSWWAATVASIPSTPAQSTSPLLTKRSPRNCNDDIVRHYAKSSSPNGWLIFKTPGAAFHPVLDHLRPDKFDDARIVVAIGQVVVQGGKAVLLAGLLHRGQLPLLE